MSYREADTVVYYCLLLVAHAVSIFLTGDIVKMRSRNTNKRAFEINFRNYINSYNISRQQRDENVILEIIFVKNITFI